jgi:phage-related protein
LKKIREIVAFKNYFENFLLEQPEKVQNKIYKILEAIEILEQIPSRYFKHIENAKGLYEVRVQLGSNIWRVFCFFDGDRLIILLNGFQKKTQKTPKGEIEKAVKLMNEYYNQKEQ